MIAGFPLDASARQARQRPRSLITVSPRSRTPHGGPRAAVERSAAEMLLTGPNWPTGTVVLLAPAQMSTHRETMLYRRNDTPRLPPAATGRADSATAYSGHVCRN